MIINGTTHTRDIIIFPERVEGPWWRMEGHQLSKKDLELVWDACPDTLVVGTGYYGNMVILEETLECACAHEIEVVAARTEDAVDTFNKLQSDPKKKVVGAFHLTC